MINYDKIKKTEQADDPNSIVLVLEVTDMEKFKAMLERPDSIAYGIETDYRFDAGR